MNIRITNICLRRDAYKNYFCNNEHIVWEKVCSKIFKKANMKFQPFLPVMNG